MDKRQAVLDALAHRDGPVPIDFGGTPVSGMHCSCVAALRDKLGLEKRPVLVHEPYQMLGWIDDDLADALDIATAAPMPQNTILGVKNRNFKSWRTPWGQEVLVGENFEIEQRGKDIYLFAEGDRSFPPSAHLPDAGYFFDAIVRQEPLDEDNLKVEDNLAEFGILSDDFLRSFTADCQDVAAKGRAVVSGIPGAGLGDIALVPAPFMKNPKGIRDITEWYISLAGRQEFVHEIFARQTEITMKNLRLLNDAVGQYLDVVMLCGTDFGTQNAPFCGEATFDSLYLPYYRKMTDWIHANTKWQVFKHSCGAIYPLLPHFRAAGFDVLNPVQCSAHDMAPERLKAEFGDSFTFWGGGVDTQRVLPFGTPAEVRAQVLQRCEIFSRRGGFVFNAIHNIQALTPVENILAMIDAVREFNRG